MPSTTFELSEDGQMLTLHGLKGRWNTDETCESNLEARRTFPECIACQNEKMTHIEPIAMAKWLSDSIDLDPRLKDGWCVRVSAYVAVMLFLEGKLHKDSLTLMLEQDGEVVIPNVRVGNYDLTLYVARGDYCFIETVYARHLAMMATR